jgi:hypothetical protein
MTFRTNLAIDRMLLYMENLESWRTFNLNALKAKPLVLIRWQKQRARKTQFKIILFHLIYFITIVFKWNRMIITC